MSFRIGTVLEREAYQVARQVYEGEIRPTDAIDYLADIGLNRSSARDFLYILKSMLDGVVYKRAMSTGATDYFMQKVREHYGPEKLANAIAALRLHISYKGDAMPGYLAIADKYEEKSDLRLKPQRQLSEVQILPMSAAESDELAITEVQEEYFLNQLPFQRKGSYRCYTTITAPPGSLVLFQYAGKIIATARLIGKGRLRKRDVDGYSRELLFDPASIRIFEPIEAVVISRIWRKVRQLDQTRWKLDPRRLPVFEQYVRHVRVPGLRDGDAETDSDAPGYVPSGLDTRGIATSQIRLRRGQQRFRNDLLKRYGNRCLVTGSSIVALLEAAHILPFRGSADNHPENGLLLRADVHTLFDLNLLGIEPNELRIKLRPHVAKEYAQFNGQCLRCSVGIRPSKDALRERYREFIAKHD